MVIWAELTWRISLMMLFPDDPHFSENDARRRLAAVNSRVHRCVMAAMEDINLACKTVERLGPALAYNGSRAHVFNALVVESIRREFFGDEANVVTEDRGFLELMVGLGGEVRTDLRFKKLDSENNTMNLATAAQDQYRNILPMAGGGDAERILRLTIGWRWNAAATEVVDVRVVYVKGYDVAWSYSLDDDVAASGAVPMPASPMEPTGGGMKYHKEQPKDDKALKAEGAS